MTLDSIQIRLNPQSNARFSYKICNCIINADKKISALSAFKVKQAQYPQKGNSCEHAEDNPVPRLLFKGSSWLAGQNRELSCTQTTEGFLIEVPPVTSFLVETHQPRISQLHDSDNQVSNAIFEEILLGPPLMLSLAVHQRFALHASAVRINDKSVLFVGESGSGKSTLARWLGEISPCERLADDIAVIEHDEKQFRLCPDFLQMKLAGHQQHANSPAIELAAVVVINRKQDSEIKLNRLNALTSIQALVNHSVAAQLFDKPLAKRHLAFMSELTRDVPVYKLAYPDGQTFTHTITEILTNQIN